MKTVDKTHTQTQRHRDTETQRHTHTHTHTTDSSGLNAPIAMLSVPLKITRLATQA